MKKIIFTDLDGTLLDHKTYSYANAEKALRLIKKKKIPLIICTSKTRQEIVEYRKKLSNKEPFISENGGGIFIPKKYFSFSFPYDKIVGGYYLLMVGTNYKILKEAFKKIKKIIPLKGFSDMSFKDVSEDAGLTINQAKLAKKRDFTEPFKLLDPSREHALKVLIKKLGFNLTRGGRYYHLMGKNNKGLAVKKLIGLYKKEQNIKNGKKDNKKLKNKRKSEKITSLAFGDSKNDFEMLKNVDEGYLVKQYTGSYVSKKFKYAGDIGPKGFNKIVLRELLK